MSWHVPPIFAGQTVAILASGPSMSQAVADRVRHLPRVAVNTTYRLAPDADIIYASDGAWWKQNPEAVNCPGLKVSVEARDGCRHPYTPDAVHTLRHKGRHGFDDRTDCLRTMNNSGGAAIHVAVQARAARILLLGFDMHGGHWHGQHQKPLGNPGPALLRDWCELIAEFARAVAGRVEILNCTPGSALRCFPMVSLDEALDIREAA